jgi:hypothetical protein
VIVVHREDGHQQGVDLAGIELDRGLFPGGRRGIIRLPQ